MALREYCTSAEVRAEWTDSSAYGDARIISTIQECSQFIENATGRIFGSTANTKRFQTTGQNIYDLGEEIVSITSIKYYDYDDNELDEIESNEFRVFGSLIKIQEGYEPIEGYYMLVTGNFGTQLESAVPREIRKACLKLVKRELPLIGDDNASDDKLKSRIVSERLGDYSVTYEKTDIPIITGDQDVDRIIQMYSRSSETYDTI